MVTRLSEREKSTHSRAVFFWVTGRRQEPVLYVLAICNREPCCQACGKGTQVERDHTFQLCFLGTQQRQVQEKVLKLVCVQRLSPTASRILCQLNDEQTHGNLNSPQDGLLNVQTQQGVMSYLVSVAPDNLEGQGHGSSGSLYVQPPARTLQGSFTPLSW